MTGKTIFIGIDVHKMFYVIKAISDKAVVKRERVPAEPERLIFVPEASAALGTAKSWKSGVIHNATTITISQWIGNLIHCKDLMDLMSSY